MVKKLLFFSVYVILIFFVVTFCFSEGETRNKRDSSFSVALNLALEIPISPNAFYFGIGSSIKRRGGFSLSQIPFISFFGKGVYLLNPYGPEEFFSGFGGGGGVRPGSAGSAGPRASRYNLDGQKLGDSGFVKWLEETGPGDGIVELRLRNNALTSAAIVALAKSMLGAPEVLMLTGNPTGDAGAQVVADSETFGGLRILYLDNTGTSAVGVKALFGGSSKLRWLEEIVLSGNAIGDEGVAAIAASLGSAHLTGLYLVGVGMTDEGARALANSDYLGDIQQLSVSGNLLTKAGIKALKESSKLPKCELDL